MCWEGGGQSPPPSDDINLRKLCLENAAGNRQTNGAEVFPKHSNAAR